MGGKDGRIMRNFMNNPLYQESIYRRMYADPYQGVTQAGDIDRAFAGRQMQLNTRDAATGSELGLRGRGMAISGGLKDLNRKFLDVDRDRDYSRRRGMFETAKKQNRIATGINIGNLGLALYGTYDMGRQQREREARMRSMQDDYNQFADWFVKRLSAGGA